MKNLFTFKKDLWNSLTSSNPELLTDATMHKIDAITYYLEDEIQNEYNLPNELISDVRTLFDTKVWHYTDEQEFELPIDVMLGLLVDCFEIVCYKYDYSEEKIVSMMKSVKELVNCAPDSFEIHEHKIRAMVIRSFIIDKLVEKGCPNELSCQIVPAHREIEHRLILDTFNCDNV